MYVHVYMYICWSALLNITIYFRHILYVLKYVFKLT